VARQNRDYDEGLTQFEQAARYDFTTYAHLQHARLLGNLLLPRIAEYFEHDLGTGSRTDVAHLRDIEEFLAGSSDDELLPKYHTGEVAALAQASGLARGCVRSIWSMDGRPHERARRIFANNHAAAYDYVAEHRRWRQRNRYAVFVVPEDDIPGKGVSVFPVPRRWDKRSERYIDEDTTGSIHAGAVALTRALEVCGEGGRQGDIDMITAEADDDWASRLFAERRDLADDEIVAMGVMGEPIINALTIRRAAVQMDEIGVNYDTINMPLVYFGAFPVQLAATEAQLDQPRYVSPYYALRTIVQAARMLVEDQILR
jgi:hypothetical protein